MSVGSRDKSIHCSLNDRTHKPINNTDIKD